VKPLGAQVVMITTSPVKGKDAVRLGADEVLVPNDAAAMAKQANSLHFRMRFVTAL
jgi:alcohol dehydrogenase (NADP+)